MTRYNNASFPPFGPWDQRLSEIACPDLTPVETLHVNPWFAVRNRGGYFTLEYHLHQVAVLPVVNNDSIAMVRVKRPVVDDMTLELPAGGIEKGEDPAYAASRELAEETGIVISDAGRYVPMPPIAVSSTRMPRLSYVFFVDVSEEEFTKRQPHDQEIHSVERIPLRELPRLMMTGGIYVSIPLAILGVFLSSRQLTGSM
ncbi:MAG: NUDIX hydrolase [Patescibacteria group bacterium]